METVNLGILKILPTDMFADDTFNAVLDDIDLKVVGVAHLISGEHWSVRKPNTAYNVHDVVRWPAMKSHQYAECTVAGTSGSASTLNNYTTGDIIDDGTVIWRIWSLTEPNGVNGGIIKIWLSGYEYKSGDAAYYGKSIYRCIASHTATSFFADNNKWQEVYASIRPFNTSVYYRVGDTVLQDDLIYRCTTDYMSTNFNSDISNWKLVGNLVLLHEWEDDKKYYTDEIVTHNGQIYRSISDHTSAVSMDADSSEWELVTASISEWKENCWYFSGATVYYNNILYRCINDHISTLPFDFSNWTMLHNPTATIKDWVANSPNYTDQVVRYNNNLYRCIYGNNDSSWNINKWALLTDSINDWVASEYYVVGQYVNYDGILYKCITANNDSIFNKANWQKITGGSLETWASNKNYYVGDVVVNANKIYQCNTAHTSSSSFSADTNNWVEISACITRIPDWQNSTDYVIGDLVAHDAKIYRCTIAHTSNAQWNVAEEDDWEELSPTINEISTWSVSTDYAIGQLVINNNKLYRCNTAHTSDSTSFNTDIAYWDLIGSSGIEAWKTGEVYQQGSMVVYNDKIYVCDSSHTSANPFDFTKWHEVSSTTIEDWQANTEYVENQPIEYNDTLFRANKDFTSGTTVSDDDNNIDFVYANLSAWQTGIYYREGSIVIDSDDKIYKCKQSHTSSLANKDTNWEELSKTLVEEYAQNKNYAEGAPVLYNGKLYRANTDVTNSTAVLDPTKWDNIVGSGIEQWQPSTDYSVGNVVVNNNQIYICTTAHTSDSTAFNTDIANWGLLDIKWKSENWSANTLYTANEVVLYDNRLFRCVSTHTSAVDFATDANYWLAIGSRLEVWKQNVHYKVEDVIINNNKLYRCMIEHTSTTTFDGTKWNEISPAIIELWKTSTDYKVGDIVINNNQLYRCNTVHTSNSSSFISDISKWDILDTKWQAKDWVTNTYYLVGEVVLYDNTPYRCITAHTSLGTFELDRANWIPLNANIRQWVSGVSYKVGDTVEYNGDLYRCITGNNDKGFKKTKWYKINKCNIEVWRASPDPNILALLHFDNSNCPEFNEYGDDFTKTLNPRLRPGKFNLGYNIHEADGTIVSPQYTFSSNSDAYTIEFWLFYHGDNYGRSSNSNVVINGIGTVFEEPQNVGKVTFRNTPYQFTPTNFLEDVYNHMAFVITYDEVKSFINGVLVSTSTRTSPSSIRFSAGGTNFSTTAIGRYVLDELCITKGAKYSSNFTLATEPFPDPKFGGYEKDDLAVYNDKIYRALEDNNDIEFTPSKWVEVSKSEIPYWTSGSSYSNNEVVLYGKSLYRAITNIANSTVNPAQSSDFQLLDTTRILPYAGGKDYQQYEVVTYNDMLYVANSVITSSPNNFDPSQWVLIGAGSVEDWVTNKSYSIGDIVIYDNQTYRCITAHTSNIFLSDIDNWHPLDINWLVYDWIASKLYLEHQVVSYDNCLWKCLETHESTLDDSPANAKLYTAGTNILYVDGSTVTPYSEIIDLGSVQKVTDFSYTGVVNGMSIAYNAETSVDGVTFSEWEDVLTNARYIKLTVESLTVYPGATSPNAYLSNFVVVGESSRWEKISSSSDIEYATNTDIDNLFI